MKIQNDFSRTAVSRLPDAKPPVAAEVKSNELSQPTATPSTGFDPASSFASQTNAPVNLTGALREPRKTGPVALDSAAGQAAIQKTVDFLQQQGPAAASARGLMASPGVAASDFAPRTVEQDGLGMTHVRMDRVSEGTRVFGEQVVGHINSSGKMDSVTGDVAPIPPGLGSAPTKLSAEAALAVAQQDFAGRTDRQPTSERVIFKGDDGQYRAAYHVQLSNTTDVGEGKQPRRMNYLVDANSGELLEKYNQMGGFEHEHAHAHASGTKTPGSAPATPTDVPTNGLADDTSQYSGKVQLDSTKNADGTYTLADESRGEGVVTRDALNRNPDTTSTKNAPITDDNDIWGEATDPARNKDAVDAQYGAQTTYDFYKEVLGRDSIDGKGEKLISDVHVGTHFANAFWDGEKMNYGDGDGQTFGSLTTLDIAGHEISHGLTERTAGLQYRNESGALNEAISDIMGTGVEWFASQKNEAVKFDWTVGEDTFTPHNGDPTDGLRDMSDPTSDGQSPDHYSKRYKGTQDNGGVHINSGIPNNAFYLLSEGGKNRTSGTEVKDGIGIEKSLKIYSRALSFYMTPTTNFAQAREATFKAAQDLYGKDSTEARKVLESWSAVGVG
ncbi:M4 family metallopeptidase [Archangium violaceum]|uniref:Neutral metalloproteinase n=1 Tax=Archangium violaceum Cb vi76 TaxID=1406225 RepID=A0A084SFN7_9BACT|nr:M4 family metallopeptidase [Archangium violaceum]KFA87272.1 peptidase M4 [Archangium violaceum Cb vi76]